jgi:tripeptidyl-peptidase I
MVHLVSDPDHARYGQHLSAEEVHELIKPSHEASDAVHEWLREYGFDAADLSYSPAKDWISVKLPVSAVEDLLSTEYAVWEHEDGSTVIRTEGYSLPNYVHRHISTIQPTNTWARLDGNKKIRHEINKRSALQKRAIVVEENWSPPAPLPLPANATVQAACNFSAVTPNCLRTLYGTLDYTAKSAGANKMGHNNFLEEANNRSDTYIFLSKYRPEAAQAAYEFTQISVAGGVIDNGTNRANEVGPAGHVGREANLDAEYMLGVGYPTPLTTWSTGGRDPAFIPDINTPVNTDEPFLTWVNYILSQPDSAVPQVISTSYADDEQTVSPWYAEIVCNQFAQLGARGVTLFFSSGDFGVGPDST